MNSGPLHHSSRLDATAGGDIGRHTTRAEIGGQLDYRALAELHRPSDPVLLKAELQRLADGGLTPTDIATSLRMHLAQVLELLAYSEPRQ